MKNFSRRDFLKIGGVLAAARGVVPVLCRRLRGRHRAAFQGSAQGAVDAGQSCSGCSVSLLNADNPYVLEVVTDMISLVYHQTLSAATGDVAVKAVDGPAGRKEPFLLVVEGPFPSACRKPASSAGSRLATCCCR
jgi:hydrogenase small subunit